VATPGVLRPMVQAPSSSVWRGRRAVAQGGGQLTDHERQRCGEGLHVEDLPVVDPPDHGKEHQHRCVASKQQSDPAPGCTYSRRWVQPRQCAMGCCRRWHAQLRKQWSQHRALGHRLNGIGARWEGALTLLALRRPLCQPELRHPKTPRLRSLFSRPAGLAVSVERGMRGGECRVHG
jgi:hypothetical protein